MSIESNKLVNLADAQVLYNDLRDRESDLKSALKDVENDIGYEIIDLENNKTIVTANGTNITPEHMSTELNWCCCCVPCSAGDVFTITGYGGSSTRLWAFSDLSGNVVGDQAPAQDSKTNYKVTAPTNAVYFAFNSRMGSTPYVYKGVKLQATLGEINEQLDDLKSAFDTVFEQEFKVQDIATFTGVTKLADYSFAPSENYVSGTANSDYDSYYFYAKDGDAVYFASSSIPTPSYCSITVGKNPSKEWVSYGGGSGIGMICDSVERYRNINNNLPVESSPLDVSDCIVIFTVNKGYSAEFYYNFPILNDDALPLLQSTGTNTKKAMSQKAVTDAISAATNKKDAVLKYIYGSGGGASVERVAIYIPTFDGYINYQFVHSYDLQTNCDVWRIDGAYAVDDNFTNPVDLTATGEWEFAVRLANRDDFSGGILHGDEKYNSIVFCIDGSVVDITGFTDNIVFSELIILQESNIYDPDDHTTIIGVHTSEHKFTANNNIVIKQTMLWNGAYDVTGCYMGMFPISKAVSDKWYSNKNLYPVVIPNQGTYYTGITNVTLFKESANVFGTFVCNKLPDVQNAYNKTFLITDNGGGTYNKCYYVVCGTGATSQNNELWESETVYYITKGKAQ